MKNHLIYAEIVQLVLLVGGALNTPLTSSVRLCFGSDSQEQESFTDINAELKRYKLKFTMRGSHCVLVPEWLTGMTRNHVGFARAGSNPAKHAFFVFLFFLCAGNSCFCLLLALSLIMF